MTTATINTAPCEHKIANQAPGGCFICQGPQAERPAVMLSDAVLFELERSVLRDSLAEFIKAAWPLLEPNGRPYAPSVASEAVIAHLQAVGDGKIRKLLIALPPGSGKSTLATIAFLPWLWLKNPALRGIHASYAFELANTMSRRARRLVESAWYERISGIELRKDQNRSHDWANTQSGQRISVGVGGALTGYRADLAIIDDSLNAVDARSKATREGVNTWFDEALSTRLDKPDEAATIVIQQRLHSTDLIGHLLEQGGWDALILPAEYDPDRRTVTSIWEDPRSEAGEVLCPELHSQKFLAEQKHVLGTAAYAGQYLQDPQDAEGGLFQRQWWGFHKPDGTAADSSRRPRGCDTERGAVALPSAFDRTIVSLDAAFKDLSTSDNVSFVVLGVLGAERYVIDHRLGKMGFTKTCEVLKELVRKYPGATVLVEDKANGSAILNSLQKVVPNLVPINPQGGKESRAAAVSPGVEAGQIFLPEGVSWLGEWVEEFAGFPRAKHDDQVDAFTQALNYLHEPLDPEEEESRQRMIDMYLCGCDLIGRDAKLADLRAWLENPSANHGLRWRASDCTQLD